MKEVSSGLPSPSPSPSLDSVDVPASSIPQPPRRAYQAYIEDDDDKDNEDEDDGTAEHSGFGAERKQHA